MIDTFITPETRFLSNYYPIPGGIKYMGFNFPSAENAYQAAKCPADKRPFEWSSFLTCGPGSAKKLGNKLPMRDDWDKVKVDVMRQICSLKFNVPELEKMLMDTGDQELIEGNFWNDQFWGVCNGKGGNWLGRILMDIRNQKNLEKIINSAGVYRKMRDTT